MPDKILGAPKKVVIVAGAVAVGILGYAWYKRGDAGTVTEEPLEASADEYVSPLGNSGTNSTATVDNTDTDKIDTNGEWVQAAVEYLQSVGVDAAQASAALGKLLAFKSLTTFEASVAMQAKAAFGEPPVGGPYPIKDALPTPPSTTIKPGAIVNLHQYGVYGTSVYLDWNDAKDSRGYDIEYTDAKGKLVKKTALTSSYTASNLTRNHSYTFRVRARPNIGTTSGDWASISVKTKAK
jgi:hypothetical protein